MTSRGQRALAIAVLMVIASSFIGPGIGASQANAATPPPLASCPTFLESSIRGTAAAFTYGPQNRLWLSEGGLSQPLLRGVSPGGGADLLIPLLDPDANGMQDPQGLAVGDDGRMWIVGGSGLSGAGGQRIAAVNLSSREITSFALQGSPVRVAAGSDRNLWVTLNSSDEIAKVDISGTVVRYALPAGSRPWGITAASDGALWFAEEGRLKIGRITTAGVITEYDATASPHDIVANGGDLWFTERAASRIGHVTISGPSITMTPTVSGRADPIGIAVGMDGGVWFTEHDADRVGRLDPRTGAVNETLITISSSPPTEMIALPDGTIWFANEVNRLEHFKPKPDGTVGPLPPSVALTAGSPAQPGPVYSTSTPFTIAGTTPDQCLDTVTYRFYLAGTPPPAYPTPMSAPQVFSLPADGTWAVDFYGTGPGGQSITQTVTLVVDQSRFAGDIIPPVLTVPANVSVPATSVAGATVTYTATATDPGHETVPVTVTCTPSSGSLFPIATTTVSCTAVDATGNSTPGSFTVTVFAGPPVLTVPTDLVVAAAGPTTPVTFTASAVSPWGGNLPVTCTPPGTKLASPATFTVAFRSNVTTPVTCVSTDGRGQSTSARFTVTPVTPYTATQFVIWGGNPGGVVEGQRVVFWGEHWWDTVNLPERAKVQDFKGWAATVNGTTWSTKPGNSKPPRAVPTYISVIITTQIDRPNKGADDGDKGREGDGGGALIRGNIVGHAILRVVSPYKGEPGKPVYGVVVAVLP